MAKLSVTVTIKGHNSPEGAAVRVYWDKDKDGSFEPDERVTLTRADDSWSWAGSFAPPTRPVACVMRWRAMPGAKVSVVVKDEDDKDVFKLTDATSAHEIDFRTFQVPA